MESFLWLLRDKHRARGALGDLPPCNPTHCLALC